MTKPDFVSKGTETSSIDVKISYRIIQLFSEGLYSSPNKAIEELVSNSFDAGAEKVHVVLPVDFGEDGAAIVVIDDGEGMDGDGLENHWIIGQSTKRDAEVKTPKGRKPIGKFGIGKLATYVLANRLTHVSKVNGKYYAASMDYSEIPQDGDGGAGTLQEHISIPLRELTAKEAKEAVQYWTEGEKEGYKSLNLFGAKAKKSWTVVIMSELKDMVNEIKRGRLSWILSTAMPLRSDFNLYLNGEAIDSSKLKGKRIGTWTIGKNLKKIPKPASEEFEVTEDSKAKPDSTVRFGVTHPQLGRVTGKVELFNDLLTKGKASELGRSHGFFVSVRGRLVNADDAYFGISSNKLRHGTFSRFRCEVQIDRLDDELRSSRETVRETSLIETSRDFLEGVFNFCRRKHEAFEESEAEGLRATSRVADSPASLTRTPLKHLVVRALNGKGKPSLTRYPTGLSEKEKSVFLKTLDKNSSDPQGLIREIVQAPLGQNFGIAVYDAELYSLQINSLHPFVAYFGDEFSDAKQNLPLELLATSEVLLEASMYDLGIPERRIKDVMDRRDSLLRELAKTTGKRNALMISQDLQNASSNLGNLREELITACDSLGFAVVPQGGARKRDGVAQAHLAGAGKSVSSYSVSLEARAKLEPNKLPTASTVGVSKIIRKRDDKDLCCDHAFVVMSDFPRKSEDVKKIREQINDDFKATGRTITFMKVVDLARLVRLSPAKRLGLTGLKDLFLNCITPAESKAWVDGLESQKPSTAPYKEILEAIHVEQEDMPEKEVEYSVLEARLRIGSNIIIEISDIIGLCHALHRITPEYVYAGETTVAITSSPTRILATFNASIKEYPSKKKRKAK